MSCIEIFIHCYVKRTATLVVVQKTILPLSLIGMLALAIALNPLLTLIILLLPRLKLGSLPSPLNLLLIVLSITTFSVQIKHIIISSVLKLASYNLLLHTEQLIM